MLKALARCCVRFRWLVVVGWLLLAAGVGVGAQDFGGSFTDDLSVEGTDSQAAYDALAGRFPTMSGDGMQVVLHDRDGVTGPHVESAVEDSLAEVGALGGIAETRSPYSAEEPLISTDGNTAVATVRFTERAGDIEPETIEWAQEAFDPVEDLGVQVEFGGPALNAESGPSGTELIGLGAAVVVLLIAFGSIFAMVVPLVTAVLALGLGLGIIHLLAGYISIGTEGPIVAAMIGLGVGIDYALLVVTRHREGLASGHSARESIPVALSTAGRSVLIAGGTVIAAILSLYVIDIPFVATLGLASAITVATTLLAAVTLLPALLGIFGDKLDLLRVRKIRLDAGSRRRSGWHRWSRAVQRHPWLYLLVGTVVLAAIAIPLFDLRLGTADGGSAPADSTERAAYELVEESFGPGWTGPLIVTAEYEGGTADAAAQAGRLRSELADTKGVDVVSPPRFNGDGDTAVLTVVPTTSPDDEATEDLVQRLRNDVTADASYGDRVHVGGATATAIDLADKIGERMAWFIAFVVGCSLLLLLVEFRSLFVPIKAAVLNLLSVGAAYGVVVAVFQWGWLEDWTGIDPGPIESFAPIMLFAVLFGLSMDYEVFLLSRVREEYVRTGDANTAVADGIAATARVITAAAAVMVVVFASFMLNDERVVNLFGFGLAVAIAIDATLIRLVLVPAVMAIAGRKAWYLPMGLHRIPPHAAMQEPLQPLGRGTPELEPARAGPRRLDIFPASADGDPPVAGNDKAMEAREALAVLRRVVEEDQQEWRERYERLAREHAALKYRFDVVRKALQNSPVARALDLLDHASPADETAEEGVPPESARRPRNP